MVNALRGLSGEERARIDAAIAAAQAQSKARFACVIVPASDRYHLYPVVWGAVLALTALGALAMFAPHAGLRAGFALAALVFLAASLALEWRPLRLLIVPRKSRHEHARALAHREFAVRILAHPEKAGGVLFFVSLAERYAEVIADHALHQAAGQAAYDKIVGDFLARAGRGELADAVAQAAQACGTLLAGHRPKG